MITGVGAYSCSGSAFLPASRSPFLNRPFHALEPLRWKTELPSLAGPLQKIAGGSASPNWPQLLLIFSTVVACGWSSGHAGVRTRHIGLHDNGRFVDLQGQPIQRLFKLHAWEHIFHEYFGQAITGCDTQFVEPPWKALISNKGILPLLWEWFEGHPNLLPAFVDDNPQTPVPKGWVRKPYFSREGANVDIRTEDGRRVFEDGPYDDASYILQAFAPLPKFVDSYTLIGSWVIGDKASGLGIREDDSLITKDSSRFLPHVVLG